MQTSSSSAKYGNQQSKLLEDLMQFREMQLLQNPLCTTGTEIKRGKESLEGELNSKPGAPSNDENVPKVQWILLFVSNILRLFEVHHLSKKRVEKRKENWFLHHDNMPCHICLTLQQVLVKNQILTITQPPGSPHLALCNMWFFQRPTTWIQCHCFTSVPEIQQHATVSLTATLKKLCQKCRAQWQDGWNKKTYVLKASTSSVTQLRYVHIPFYHILCPSSKTLRSSHLLVLSYCTQICNFLPILEGTLSPPYFFQYNQQLWQSLHCICDGPHAYHWLEIVTTDRIYKIFRMT